MLEVEVEEKQNGLTQEVKVNFRQIPLELDLPKKMELICLFHRHIDQALSLLMSRQTQASFTNIK